MAASGRLLTHAERQQPAKSSHYARAEADAKHREALAVIATQDAQLMLTLLRQNTDLTTLTNTLAARIETLTVELHRHMLQLGKVALPPHGGEPQTASDK